MKKILMLGGIRYLLPVIKAAHDKGCYVITCDYLPNNVAHRYSDEFCNVSITDKERVLAAASELGVDGIMSFGTDPGVETAAYVAEKLSLPSCGSYEAVRVLQQKSLFRKFLKDNGFNVPFFKSFSSLEDCLDEIGEEDMPVIVKPTDSAGSKGVSKASSRNEMAAAVANALRFSRNGQFIVEEFIEPQGFASDSECFSVDGKLVFASFFNQHFDKKAVNPYVPSAYSWPSTMEESSRRFLESEIQRLVSLLGLGTSIYNVETRVGKNGKPYIMECSPRGGGNRLAEIVSRATGVDLIGNAVAAAIGESVNIPANYCYDGYWAECILHAYESGSYRGIEIDERLLPFVNEKDEWLSEGDGVDAFEGANASAGTVVFRFDDKKTSDEYMSRMFDLVKVKVQ